MKITKQRLKQIIREELEMALDEEDATEKILGDKKTEIVRSWISWAFKGKCRPECEEWTAFIAAMKKWGIPKPLAMQILKAKDEKAVAKLVDAPPTE